MITNENAAGANEIKEAKEMARMVIAHHFGNKKPRRINHLVTGLSNFVFAVLHSEGDFIVRISPDPTRINLFIKEQWAQDAANKIGVPVPEILEVGNEIIGIPFMVSRKVEGREATFHPKRLEILEDMGRYGSLINTIPTEGFGSTFDWSGNQLSQNESWREFLEKELQMEARLKALEKHKMLDAPQLKKIRRILLDAGETNLPTTLNHGDIRLKNVMVNDEGQITAFLDWEHCMSNLAPFWELSIALHDLSIDEKQVFLKGYDLKEKKIREIMPVVKAVNFINYAPEIERLAGEKDIEHLEQFRTRLSGALDFYSFC